jgi:hypothetical protein
MALNKNVPLVANQITADLTAINANWEELMKSSHIYAADAGTTDAYAITLDPAPSAYTTGMVINFYANTANTGAATLNVNSLGAKTIKKHHDQDLADGDIEAGQIVTVVYDGTNFQMQSQSGLYGQIPFPATQNASADANTLDDYEEGSWTPALEGSVTAGDTTYTVQVGRYEKIGRQVTIRGRITVDLQGTLDGYVKITGLPFVANADPHTYSAIHIGYGWSLAITAGESLAGYVEAGTNYIYIRIWNNTSGADYFDDAELTDGASLMFMGIYHI